MLQLDREDPYDPPVLTFQKIEKKSPTLHFLPSKKSKQKSNQLEPQHGSRLANLSTPRFSESEAIFIHSGTNWWNLSASGGPKLPLDNQPTNNQQL